MINGDVKDFINGLHYGDERFFIYDNKKYFIQGYIENNRPVLEIYVLEPIDCDFKWRALSSNSSYPVLEFENAKIFNNKSFWDVEKDIEWVDN